MAEPDKPYKAEFYTTPRGESLFDEFVDELPEKHQGKIDQWVSLLEQYGPDLPRPYADVLDGPIRELRVQFGNYKYRFLYFIHGKVIVITHGILKKTGPVPVEEIDRAKRYRQDWLDRHG